jgi:murein L,D-transpeptidase YcbB/YkuD
MRQRRRLWRLAGLAVTLASALGLAACEDRPDTLSGQNADLALATLKAASGQGFAAERFRPQRIEQLLHATSRDDRAEGVRELRAALVDYARAQHGLTIPKAAFPKDWGLKPTAYDAEAGLASALQNGSLKAWLDDQTPPSPAYRALQAAYVSYLRIAASGGWPAVSPATPPAVLRQRLALEDPQLAATPADAPAGPGLTDAIGRFQAAHGLPVSGQSDAATVEQLNVPAEARAAQIRASLERLRWLPRQEPATRIDVNIAAAEMSYYRDGQLTTHMLAASGRPGGDETPMLKSAVDAIVLNPPWNVPPEIAEQEIIPKGEAYLQAKGFAMKDGRLVQQPGPDAALGQVKFDFANPYAVYLHDTPAKAAFASSQRAVSHGCVRLAQAVDFAKTLLADEPGWSAARVDETLASGQTIRIGLTHKVPVRLIYLTAFPEGDHIAFRPDVYGWDARLLQMLDHPPAAPKAGERT